MADLGVKLRLGQVEHVGVPLSDEGDDSDRKEDRWHGYLLPLKLVRRAGIRTESFVAVYWLCKLVPAVVVPLLPGMAGVSLPFVWGLLIGFVAAFGVELWIVLRMRRRQQRIQYALSYFIDMTTAFLRAGMSLNGAIERAIVYGLPLRSPLRQELNIVRSEILAGRSREEAFSALWERTGVSDLQSLASAFRIGFDIGTPILTALEHQAELLRERTRERRQKRINGKVTQAMIPLVLLNFPMMLIIVFYPPLIEFSRILFLAN